MTYTLQLFSSLSAADATAALHRLGYTRPDGMGAYLHHTSDQARFARACPASAVRVAVPEGVHSVIEFADYQSQGAGGMREPFTAALTAIVTAAEVVGARETTGHPVNIRELRASTSVGR